MIRKLVTLVAFLLLPCVSHAANWLIPTNCGDCAAAVPVPDPETASLLDNFGNSQAANYLGPAKFAVGDTVTICNAVGCSTYTFSQNKLYDSGTYVPAVSHKPTKGGGGGGSGAGGGGVASGGSGIGDPTPPDGDGCPGCNPTVTVGAS